MAETPRDFYLEEYKHLKQQVSLLTDRVSTILQYILGGIAAIYTWVFTNKVPEALWVPVPLAVYGGVLALVIFARIRSMRRYLKDRLEPYLSGSLTREPEGWEKYRASDKTAGLWKAWVAVFWITLIIGTIIIAIWVRPSHP